MSCSIWLTFDMKNCDGEVLHREYERASDFLEDFESDDIDVALSCDNEVSNIVYRGIQVDQDETVVRDIEDLYNYFCRRLMEMQL